MSRSSKKTRDPVCEMLVESKTYVFKFMGCQYLFCSQQCLDRFESNPHLYIGKPGKASIKQSGEHIIKHRILKLDQIISPDATKLIISTVNDMMGIKYIKIEGQKIDITFDLLEVTSKQIELTLERLGNEVSASWGASLKSAFIHYAEEAELDNLEDQHSTHKHHH